MPVSYSSGVSLSGGATSPATATSLGLVKGPGIASDGTLTGAFTETTAAPNGTVPVAAAAVTSTFSNSDVAIVPKGTGGFALGIADSTPAGGNKRGIYAVDLQVTRISSSQVASGINSLVLGSNNTASGTNSVTLGGNGNTATGVNSTTIGGAFATTNGVIGQVAFGHNSDVLGRYQSTRTGLRQATTGATAVRATADAASASASNQLAVRTNSAVRFIVQVVAVDTVTMDAKGWIVNGAIKRSVTAASTALVGVPTSTSGFADTAATTWDIAILADTVNGCLAINVNGAGTNTIRWMAQIQTVEVSA